MARLTYLAKKADLAKLGNSKIPIVIDERLCMSMEMNAEFVATNVCPSKSELQQFLNKYRSLTADELSAALHVNHKDFFQVVSQMVPCIGCRRSIEVVHSHAQSNGIPSFFPMLLTKEGCICLDKSKADILSLWYLFHSPSQHKLDTLEFLEKSKSGRRCDVHSMESPRFRAVTAWLEVWEAMDVECQKQTLIIDSAILLICISDYLVKHRFCEECKLQVLKAFHVLMGDKSGEGELGYDPALYEDLEVCSKTRYIHVAPDTSLVSSLIAKCIPELSGGQRERHAKTLDIAQEEVLICLGLCVFERLHRIHMRFSAEERSWELMMCVGMQCLKQSFETAVEKKMGMDHLEMLCKEFADLDKAKEKSKKGNANSNGKKANNNKANKKKAAKANPPVIVEHNKAKENCEKSVDVKESVPEVAEEVKTGKKKRKKNKTAKKKAKLLLKEQEKEKERLAAEEAATPPDSPKTERSRSQSPQPDLSGSSSTPSLVCASLQTESSPSLSQKSELSLSSSPKTEPSRSPCSPLIPGLDCGYGSGNNADNPGCSSPDSSVQTKTDRPMSASKDQLKEETISFYRNVTNNLLASACKKSTPITGRPIEYRTLEEQLEDGSGNDDDDYEIPEEEISAFNGSDWRLAREERRRNMELQFKNFLELSRTGSTAGQSSTPTAESKPILQNTSAKSNARPSTESKPMPTSTELKGNITNVIPVKGEDEKKKEEKENNKCESKNDEEHEQPGCGGPLRWCKRKRV